MRAAFGLAPYVGPGLLGQTAWDALAEAASATGLSRREIKSCLSRAARARIAGSAARDGGRAGQAWRPRFRRAPEPLKLDAAAQARAIEADPRAGAWLKPGFGEAELWESSPVRAEPENETALALSLLYRPSERINIVTQAAQRDGKWTPVGRGETRTREEWLAILSSCGLRTHPQAGAWMRINPLDGAGIADPNVTDCRYLLIESDSLPESHQLALIASLPGLALAVHSGGRSWHAWVRVDAADADEYRELSGRVLGRLAVFGVDAANSNPSRLSRLPGVMRGGRRQRLLYLSPAP